MLLNLKQFQMENLKLIFVSSIINGFYSKIVSISAFWMSVMGFLSNAVPFEAFLIRGTETMISCVSFFEELDLKYPKYTQTKKSTVAENTNKATKLGQYFFANAYKKASKMFKHFLLYHNIV